MAVDRDRDASGRPRNARLRDGLGRPLPRGVPGYAPTEDEAALPPTVALLRAQVLLDEGRPFHAHEVLEAQWKSGPEVERNLWQGLAQLAVGLTHALRGNSTGAVTVLTRGRDNIAAFAADPPYGIDVESLTKWASAFIADPTSPTTPRLTKQAGS